MARPPVRTSARGAWPRQVHVLTLVDHLVTTGGAEKLALEIATRLDRVRFRSTMCVSRFAVHPALREQERHTLELVRTAGIGFLPLARRGSASVLPWRRLIAFLRRERVDVLHAHMVGSNAWGTVVGRLARVPVIVAHEHTWSFEGEPLRQLVDRELIGRFSDAFIAVSREDRRKMIEIERVPAERIRFVPNGIAARSPTGADVRAELGLGDGPLIGAVGTLRRQKSYDTLVRAAAILRERHPGLHAIIAGAGQPEEERLRALIDELGLGDVVFLIGARMDVPDVLAALDVAVSTSSFEGSPLSVMEYMEAGLPIVATAVGGVPDLIDPGEHGLLVEPGDPGAVASAVDELLRDPDRARALGEMARERRRREFDLDVMVGNLEALYGELLAASPRASWAPG